MKRSELAHMIDHTLLKPESTRADVDALAKEAGELGTYSICVSPSMLPVDTPAGVSTGSMEGETQMEYVPSSPASLASASTSARVDSGLSSVWSIMWANSERFIVSFLVIFLLCPIMGTLGTRVNG